jgi:hypothetical protein
LGLGAYVGVIFAKGDGVVGVKVPVTERMPSGGDLRESETSSSTPTLQILRSTPGLLPSSSVLPLLTRGREGTILAVDWRRSRSAGRTGCWESTDDSTECPSSDADSASWGSLLVSLAEALAGESEGGEYPGASCMSWDETISWRKEGRSGAGACTEISWLEE